MLKFVIQKNILIIFIYTNFSKNIYFDKIQRDLLKFGAPKVTYQGQLHVLKGGKGEIEPIFLIHWLIVKACILNFMPDRFV